MSAKKMKRFALVIVAATCLPYCASAGAEEKKVCLSSVCIGGTLADIPKDLKWRQTAPFDPKKTHFLPSGWNRVLSDNIQADPSVIKELERYRDHTGGLGLLNAKVIAILTKIRGACGGLTLSGEFFSDSGHPTTVTIKAYPSADGTIQQLRVSKLSRYYKNLVSDEERDRFADQLQAQFDVPVRATFMSPVRGAFQRNVPMPREDQARVTLDRPTSGTGSYLTIRDSELSANHGGMNQDTYRRLLGCSQAQKID
jgi:hypothetical protein